MISATFHPAQPTIGDPIAIDFAQPVTLDASPAFELVSHTPTHVVIRTFEPKPIPLSGVAGGVRFRNLVVPVRSVLKAGEKLEPSPLKPPRELAAPMLPLILIGCAALAAIAAWLFVWRRSRRRAAVPVVVLAPAEQFRADVARAAKSPQRWAALADATRAYLARRGFGAELTTSQILSRVPHERELIADILRRGDYEKFSPWGEPMGDFDVFVRGADAVIDAYEPRVEGEVAA
jgi:hypothetical protein